MNPKRVGLPVKNVLLQTDFFAVSTRANTFPLLSAVTSYETSSLDQGRVVIVSFCQRRSGKMHIVTIVL